MPKMTYPSSLISFVDVPEIEEINAKFFYNFFVPDESVNASVDPRALKVLARSGLGTSFKGMDNAVLEELTKRAPRFVKVSWRPFKTKFVQTPQKIRGMSIKRNMDFIQEEATVSNGRFTGLSVQDTGADQKLDAFLAVSAAMSETTNTTENSSNNDLAKAVNERTSANVSPEFLANAMNSQTAESDYIDEATKTVSDGLKAFTAKDIVVNMQLNNKFIGKLIQSAANDSAGIYSDEMSDLVDLAKNIQGKTIGTSKPSAMTEDEYEITVEPSRVRLFDVDVEADTYAKVEGYIIDKFERNDDGSLTKLKEIVIENETATTYLDTEVKYGTIYMYQIRAIAQIEFQSFSDDHEDIVSITTFATSKPSRKATVICEEKIPPTSPADFKPVWDFTNNKLYLMWNFPVNPQRDIKRFQVFRRKEITDPYELIVMLDFDDSEVLSQPRETVDPERILFSKQPTCAFCDEDFTMDSVFIYTLCSLDARNYTSNYGSQIKVWFNKQKNRLESKLVSVGGAPKSYPNLYLNEDLFVDTIRDSSHSRVHIYFDPEYLEVTGVEGDDLELLQTIRRGKGGKYQLQMINLDHQKEQKIAISIDDMRPRGREDELSELEKIRRNLNRRRRASQLNAAKRRKR